MLRNWVILPLKNIEKINERLEVVETYIKNPQFSDNIKEQLEAISDLERLISKLSLRKISPREFKQLSRAIDAINSIKAQIKKDLD